MRQSGCLGQWASVAVTSALVACGGSPLSDAPAPDERSDPPTRVPLGQNRPECVGDCADVELINANKRLDNGAESSRAGADRVVPSQGSEGSEGPALDPSVEGPYSAGVRTVELHDPARDRTFLVDVWYPIAKGSNEGSDNEYRLSGLLEGTVSLESPARRDAPIVDGGPWPVVVFSHGFGGIRFQSWFLTEHLATHGFVVASPDHPGNRLTDFARLGSEEAQAQSAVDRPLDMIYVRDQLLPGGAIERETGFRIDPDRVAASGHSFGGWTCLEVARRDPGFKAVLPLAPGFRHGVTPDMVSIIGRPIGFFGGSEDHTTDFVENQAPAYESAARPKALVRVNGAGHLDFSNLCDIRIARLFVNDGCDPDLIDPARVHGVVKTVGTAFLRRHLLGEMSAEPYLVDTFVRAQGPLDYWRED
ncbi:MAG: dienelactone hydrolase family protein [Deltaproteobacteria bacterium]|nr:dienelactone hydrolase family protein [Deltaproteobacteria bacterium]